MWSLKKKVKFLQFLSHKVHAQLMKPGQNIVIVKLLKHTISYRALCNRIETLWEMLHGFMVIDLENDFYLVCFKMETDAHHALTLGPWMILEHYFTVQQWHPTLIVLFRQLTKLLVGFICLGCPYIIIISTY